MRLLNDVLPEGWEFSPTAEAAALRTSWWRKKVVEEHGVERGWTDTNTGGYRPNANSIVERRVGMLNQVFRCLLLVATGGRLYYEQLWGPGLVHANETVNERPWPNRDSPVESLSGKPVMKAKSEHVFGEYVIYKVSSEQKSGKWQPNSENGIWVGFSSDAQQYMRRGTSFIKRRGSH